MELGIVLVQAHHSKFFSKSAASPIKWEQNVIP
jgi:hypothetical protein